MEEDEVEVPVVKEPAKDATKMDTDGTPGDAASETNANMQEDAKGMFLVLTMVFQNQVTSLC